ncbi:non-homologous end-joining DNA ligase [soil metagenome]
MSPYLPMLATSWPSAFDDDEWWFEIKWDGYRCLATGGGRGAALRSRRGLDLAGRFPGVAALAIPTGWVVDGEVVVMGADGTPDFSLLQTGAGPHTFVAFDVLEASGRPVIDQPLERRRELLADAGLPPEVVISDQVRGTGQAFHEAAVSLGLEGTLAKRAGSTYTPGRRSPHWRKIAHRRRIRAVVGGWLPGEGGRSGTFGSLLVGLWEGSVLRWIGAVGSGFTDRELAPLRTTLGELERGESAFAESKGIPKGARWVEPVIVVVVEFKELTRERHLRAPVFKGIDDTVASAVTWDSELPER